MTAAPLGDLDRLPQRARPADPTDETERLGDYALDIGVLQAVLAGLTGDELESCPGLLVVHADGRVECVAADRCPADPVLHAGTATCAEILGDCC